MENNGELHYNEIYYESPYYLNDRQSCPQHQHQHPGLFIIGKVIF